MEHRPDLLDEQSPPGLDVIQLTTEDVPSSHVYMEAQIFTPDSKRFVLHRSSHAHGSDQNDPEHRYLVCDIDDDCRLTPITDETGATAPSVTPDGQQMYYFVNETSPRGGRLTLKRVALDGTGRETILVLDTPLPGTRFWPSRIYPLSTISSDGRRLGLSSFLGDGEHAGGPGGLMVFDLESATVDLVLCGTTWCNVHPQYCRSTDVAASHDILVQENHGNACDASGQFTRLVGEPGADIHLIRDDGQHMRNMPWGRDGNEHCQGHQCWRGRTTQAITSTVTFQPRENQLIQSPAVAYADHVGIGSPGGVRNDLSRAFPTPMFYHFATDADARRLVSDAMPCPDNWVLYLTDLPAAEDEAPDTWRYLLATRTSCHKETHTHPFLSPDGTMAFFNSDESGCLQAYMIRGLDGTA